MDTPAEVIFGKQEVATLCGTLGLTLAIVFNACGAAIGTAFSSQGIVIGLCSGAQEMVKMLIPVAMSGIVGIYGLVIAVLYNTALNAEDFNLNTGIKMFGGGLATGLSGLACGYAIGVVGGAHTASWSESDKNFTMMVISSIFSEVLGVYGMIVAVIVYK